MDPQLMKYYFQALHIYKTYLVSLANLSQELAYSSLKSIYRFSIFNNPLFKSGKRCLPRRSFGNPSHSLNLVCDFFTSEYNLYNLDDLNLTYGTAMTQPQLDRIHNAINTGITSLNLNLGRCIWHQSPRQSVIINIDALNKKGCRAFYRTFRARANHKDNTSKIEQK